jgi:hypothetical protein
MPDSNGPLARVSLIAAPQWAAPILSSPDGNRLSGRFNSSIPVTGALGAPL